MKQISPNLTLPIYIRFTAKNSNSKDALVSKIDEYTSDKTIAADIKLESMSINPDNKDESHIIYSINITPGAEEHFVKDLADFLTHIFKKLFDYFPSYTEPL